MRKLGLLLLFLTGFLIGYITSNYFPFPGFSNFRNVRNEESRINVCDRKTNVCKPFNKVADGGSLKITVIAEDKPIPNLTVIIVNNDIQLSKMTDINGVVLFDGIPDSYYYIVFNKDSLPQRYEAPDDSFRTVTVAKNDLVGKTIRLKKLDEVYPKTELIIILKDDKGRPVQNTEIDLVLNLKTGPPVLWKKTDQNGVALFSPVVDPGTYYLGFNRNVAPANVELPFPTKVDIPWGKTTELKFILKSK